VPKHISRLLWLLAGLFVAALAGKWYFTADTFYQYGHYRGASVAEIAAQSPVYQTPSYCEACHEERHAQWSANNHKSVSCEVCHGAAQSHPENGKLPIPADTRKLCTLCHEWMPERPRTQPQVDLAQHSSGQQCIACHNPHAPKLAGVVAKVAGDAAAGAETHATKCASCHGADAISANDAWPHLAGQHAAYLVGILAAYKSGAQTDVMMSSIAQSLSDTEIQNLATYYAGLSCRAVPARVRVGDAAAGKALAQNCVACHGDAGVATNPAWPHIAGQTPGYLVNALKAFRAGLRKDPMMAGVVRGLSDTDIANLAAYYAAQNCGPAAQGKGNP
jgi:predicted CXXCH cytochrome family protein